MPSNAPAAAPAPAPTLPAGIEVFAAGTRMADDGTMHTITEHPSEPTPVIKPSHAPSMQERLHQLMEENVQAGGSARPI